MSEFATIVVSGLGRASLGLTIAALVVEVIVRGLKFRAPRVEQAAWAFVLLQGLWLAPITISIPTSGITTSAESSIETRPSHISSMIAADGDSASIEHSQPTEFEQARLEQPDFAAFVPTSRPASKSKNVLAIGLNSSLLLIWLAGTAWLLLLGFVRYFAFTRQLDSAMSAPLEWSREWKKLLSEHGVAKSIPLIVTPASGPALVRLPSGYRLVVPDADWRELSISQRRTVLRHELAHYLRGDLWTAFAARCVVLLHWFNPCAWWAVSRFETQTEYRCDQFAADDDSTEFASALVQLGTLRSQSLLASRSARGGCLADRVRRLLSDAPRTPHWTSTLVLTLAVLSVIPAGVRWQRVTAEDRMKSSDNPSTQSVLDKEAANDARAAEPNGDLLPVNAIFRLGVDRFRQAGEVKRLSYSKDGKRIASISEGSVIIWDAQTGRRLKQLKCKNDDAFARSITAMSFSPHGEEIAALAYPRVHVWEVDSGLELLSFPIKQGFGMAQELELVYSPDGAQLAVGGDMTIQLFDTSSGESIRDLTIENHRASFYGICWTADGAYMSAATLQPAVVTWNTQTGELIRKFEVEKGEAFSRTPTMSADGKMLLASTGGKVHFWRFQTGELIKTIELDADFIHTLVLTPDNQTVVVGSQDGFIRVVNVETGAVVRKIDGQLWIGRSMAVSPDFSTAAFGAVFPTIRQWDLKTGDEKYPEFATNGHTAEVHCVAYSPDGQLIASGGPNKQICFWDASTGRLRYKLSSPFSANRMTFTPSGEQLLTSWQYAGTIQVWNVATGEMVKSIDSGLKKVRSFKLTPDGTQLVAVVSDSKYGWHSPAYEERVQVWDFASGQKLHESRFKTASTESMALTANGKMLVTGAADGMIHIMDHQTGDEIAILPGHRHSVTSLAFNHDGSMLAAGSFDQTISIWNTQTWERLRVLKGHERAVTSVAFSPNGPILMSGEGDTSYPLSPTSPPQIRIWNAGTGEQIGHLSGHDANTSSVTFSPDSQRLVTAHGNTTLLVWDVRQFSGQ